MRFLLFLAAAVSAADVALAADTPETIFRQAAEALAAGDLSAAERGFRDLLRAQPNNVSVLGNLGVTYSRMERSADAIRVYRQALKLAPNEPGLLLNLGLAHIKQEEYAQARPLFARVDRSPIASVQSRQLLAACELFTGRPAQAIELTSTLPPSPEVLFLRGTAYLRLHRKADARATFDELLASAAPAQAHLLLGRAYADGAAFEEAAAELQQALAADPASLPAQFELAKVRIGLREFDEAERLLRSVLAARPTDGDAAYYLGALLVLSSREPEAVPYLTQARKSRPGAWGPPYYMGRALLQQGRAAQALPPLEEAAKANPDEAAVWFQLARAWQSAGRIAAATDARNRYQRLRRNSLEETRQVLAPGR